MNVLRSLAALVTVLLGTSGTAHAYIDAMDSVRVAVGSELEQTVQFATVDRDARRVLVTTRERDPGTGEWTRWTLRLGASFAIHRVTAVLPGELFVTGTEPDGTRVLERWRVRPLRGSRVTVRRRPASPLGEARPVEPPEVRFVGGVWVPPERRPAAGPWVDRLRLWSGEALEVELVDPDGRFLLVSLVGPRRLARVDVARPGALEVLATPGEVPGLALGSTSVVPLGPDDEWTSPYRGPGRAYALLTSTPILGCTGPEPVRGRRWFLVDRDNDGLFEELTTELTDLPASPRGR